MVGIGGTGMNGIAEILLNLGYKVSGSDLVSQQSTQRLTKLGADINIGHKSGLVEGADVVVISSAVKQDNVEVQEAKKLKIPVIPRAEMLAELMRLKNSVAVTGSHGKTSTTSMIARVLEKGDFDPTIIVGGRLNTIGAHAKLGEGEFIVAEADESDRSFLYLSPYIAVLTNLDEEHLDQYKTVDEIKKNFINFANKVPFYSSIILCLDDANLQSLIPDLERNIITYGFSSQADIYASDQEFSRFSSRSTLHYQNKKLGKLKLNVPGVHSIYNAMASVAVGFHLDIPVSTILEALEDYRGIGRRFELKKKIKDIMVIEDYAHHPTEIRRTLEAAKRGWMRRTMVVFQPHRYSRLSLLMNDFATSFNQADVLIVSEVYAASENPIPGISGKKLYEEIQQFGHKNVYFEPELKKIPDLVAKLALHKDMVMVLGAGSVSEIIPGIIQKLRGKK